VFQKKLAGISKLKKKGGAATGMVLAALLYSP